jgi:hypothetical protein
MRQITIAALALLPLVLGGHARADEPKPLKIPTVMTLKRRFADVRDICRPSGHKRDTWRHVATFLGKAASGGNQRCGSLAAARPAA